MLKRYAVAGLLVPALLVAVTGCSAVTAHKEEIRFGNNQPQVEDEYERSVKDFAQPLPKGVEFPKELPEGTTEKDVTYEEGFGDSLAAFYWQCAWEKSFLDSFSQKDSEASDHALNMVEKFKTLPYYKAHIEDPTDGWQKNVVDTARLGDPTEMRSEFESGCDLYQQVNS